MGKRIGEMRKVLFALLAAAVLGSAACYEQSSGVFCESMEAVTGDPSWRGHEACVDVNTHSLRF